MLIDYHLHNHFSPDSETETTALIEKLKEKGISNICITNHGEWFDKDEGLLGVFDLDEAQKRFASAAQELEVIRKKFPTVNIGLGIEIQYEPSAHKDIESLLNSIPFDFVLGSVHTISSTIISGGKHAGDIFMNMGEEKAYGLYFDTMLEWVQTGLFDVVAHFDICKKYGTDYYGPFKPEKHKDKIMLIIQAMKAKSIGIELNTGSLNKHCRELFPNPVILRWCVQAGIEHFTLGSDAHDTESAGKHIPEALAIAKEAGIKNLSTYSKRVAEKNEI